MTDFIPLNPSDQVLLVMDREIRKAGLPGAWCAFALELAGTPDKAALETGLADLVRSFPVLGARLTRQGRRFGWHDFENAIPLVRHIAPENADGNDFPHQCLLALLNEAGDAFTDPPLDFHWIEGQGRTLLAARWLHPLLDAGGVKRVFDFLNADPMQRGRYRRGDPSLVMEKLATWPWHRRLRMLWRGKRHNDWIDRLASSQPARFATPPRRLGNMVLTLDEASTTSVLHATRKRVGLGGQTLYFVGCLMRVLEAMGPGESRDGWCIPYAFNLRTGNAPTPVTGNQVSVLFAQAEHTITRQRDTLFQHLRTQRADAVRRELDQAYLPLMWLGQWLPLERYGKILRWQKSGGERASAWFSDVGELRFLKSDFLGAPITSVRHACQVTAPPGLAVLFCRFRGQLSIAINYLEPDFDVDWITRFRAHLHDELLTG